MNTTRINTNLTKKYENELKCAIDTLKATIIDNDYNLIIKILSDALSHSILTDKVTDKSTQLKNSMIMHELISCISDYGRVETNIVLHDLTKHL